MLCELYGLKAAVSAKIHHIASAFFVPIVPQLSYQRFAVGNTVSQSVIHHHHIVNRNSSLISKPVTFSTSLGLAHIHIVYFLFVEVIYLALIKLSWNLAVLAEQTQKPL